MASGAGVVAVSLSPSHERKFTHWASYREAGTARGLLFLAWLHRCFGRRAFNLVLYPVTCYFFLFRSTARRASLQYLSRHARAFPHRWSKTPDYKTVFRHMYAFGQSILDKSLAWSVPMDEKEFEIADHQSLATIMESERGQLIIGSHFGNLEYCRGFVQRYKQKTINVLVYDKHAANFVNVMQKLNPQSRMNVYQVDTLDIPLVLKLKAKMDAGEWLFIAGDRVPLSGDARTTTANFLGHPAQFPIGPYMLAKVLQCEVQLMFSYRLKNRVYFELVPFAQQVKLPRRGAAEAIAQYAQQYAAELERQTEQAPLQWFNFYPYWSKLVPLQGQVQRVNDRD